MDYVHRHMFGSLLVPQLHAQVKISQVADVLFAKYYGARKVQEISAGNKFGRIKDEVEADSNSATSCSQPYRYAVWWLPQPRFLHP